MTTGERQSPQELDTQRAEAFAGQIVGHLNGAMIALGLSAASRTGLFDTMAELPASTSDAIATRAGLQERYVRELLNQMVVAGIVDYDRGARTYRLPPEHAASLTSAAGPDNLAALAQLVPTLGGVHEELLDCFRNGGGVPYSSYPTFASMMRAQSALQFDHSLVSTQVPLVPGIEQRLEAGIDVADLGCGAGHAINLMARQWPNSRFTGHDFSEEAIGYAREEARDWALQNATFEVTDLPRMQGSNLYDLVTTFDAVHDQADPAGMLATAYRILRPGGYYLCADIAASSDVANNIDHPMAPMLYGISLNHCMTVSLAQGGEGLGAVWGQEKAVEMLGNAGFVDIEVRQVEGDILNNYYVCRKD
ncbi:MAG: class I SAM-dependent methyltransferase [Dehalococcoidia bacterium]|nr:class I SAM-dependent methyltransferase [Dehalococcoidia bacterium]